MRIAPFAVAMAFLSLSSAAHAAPPRPEELPDALRGWQDWVLHGQEAARCPFFSGETSRARCEWPSRVDLTLSDKGGTFAQTWLVSMSRPEWIPLPGDAKFWPQEVTVDGASAVVVPHSGLPGLLLKAGTHNVKGSFAWDSLPESVAVPPETGLLALSVNGKGIEFPERDAAGRVYLARKSEEGAAENKLEVVVHRKVIDDVPLLFVTRVEMHVSGKSREAVLGPVLPDGFVPMSLDSQMPARVEADGHLRVQVWPGNWVITLVARHSGAVNALAMPKVDSAWSPEEVWTFEARPNLRLATMEGLPAIDPQQTTIPEDWKRLPTYRIKPGETARLVETSRGDSHPAADQLSLARTVWLDFDGRGYSFQDRITGSLHRAWRLGMGQEMNLGRVAIDSRDQFITTTPGTQAPGVEVRQGTLDLSADSRLEGAVSSIPAVGWTHDFAHVQTVLQVPPGWRLFYATGADDVPQTWIRSWSLLDMFLVLILAIAVGRLYGRLWGAAALVTLVMTFLEPGAPRFVWIAVLIAEALVRVVPAGMAKKLLNFARLVAIAALLLVVVPFAVRQIRGAIYPALEGGNHYEASWLDEALGFGLYRSRPTGGAAPEFFHDEEPAAAPGQAVNGEGKDEEVVGLLEQNIDGKANDKSVMKKPAPKKGEEDGRQKWQADVSSQSSRYAQAAQLNYFEHDPKAMVQTGQGLPRWSWTAVNVEWSGPVAASTRLTLWLVPPWLNLIAAFLRVLLAGVLVLLLLDLPRKWWPEMLAPQAPKAAAAAALLIGLFLVAAPGTARAAGAATPEAPSPEILQELQHRLLEKPDCFPDCASSSRMDLEADAARLTLRIQIGVAAATAVPLPGSAAQWLPERVLVDGNPASGLARVADQLWVVLEPGAHQVVMDGPLPRRSTVQVRLPLRPHRVTAKTTGWTLAGLHEDGVADENLQLSRLESGAGAGAGATLSQGSLPPFVRVERTLDLGLNWQVLTRVVRVTPAGSAVVVEVPLLPGESVTTNDVRVADGKALVNMGAQAGEVEWLSSLSVAPQVKLVAPDAPSWTEIWRLDASPVWHAEATGIPVVHSANSASRTPEWRPWPGESVTLAISRPEGIAGQTLTIDHSELSLKPGKRSTDATLALDLRSSRGGQQVITLPPDADSPSITIDSVSQPIRQDGSKVTIPLVPGHQEVQISWQEKRGIGLIFPASQIDLGTPTVNADVHFEIPSDRWVLFVSRHPRLGPAVLFWSTMLVILLVAVGLGRVKFTPLRTGHWVLLGVGLSQIPVVAAAMVVAWLLALGWRKEKGKTAGPVAFNFAQIGLVGLTAVALGLLVWAVGQGLLGTPEMQIEGNSSSEHLLRWMADRTGPVLPQPWVISVPLWVYHVSMAAWALWLAFAVLDWLKWGWRCFTDGGFYKAAPKKPRPDPAPPAPAAPPAGKA